MISIFEDHSLGQDDSRFNYFFQIHRIVKPDIESMCDLVMFSYFKPQFLSLIRDTLADCFQRERQIRLMAMENKRQRLEASMAIDKYLKKKNKWMKQNLDDLPSSGKRFSKTQVILSGRRDSLHLFFEFLSDWKLSDVTADVKRICQVARLPSATFDNIPTAFETVGLIILNKTYIKDNVNRIRAAAEVIRVKSAELHLSVEIHVIASGLEQVDESEVSYGFRSKLNAFGIITIQSMLKEFDKALADEIGRVQN